MISLLKEDSSRNISFITFTRTSRRDTQRKLDREFGADTQAGEEIVVPRVGTLHATAKSIVHRYAAVLDRKPGFSILLDARGERDMVTQEVIDDLTLDIGVPELKDGISKYRCTYEWPHEFGLSRDERNRALDHFNRLLDFYNAFDFEGVVDAACHLIEVEGIDLPPLFLQVDEFQDLNPADQRFIHLVSSREGSEVVVVGDDAQSIYGFRHADCNGLRGLWNDGNWSRLNLSECFRLPPVILNAALALIEGKDYLGAALVARPANGGAITTFQCTSSEYQDIAVARRIAHLKEELTNDDGDNLSYSDFMVLCPSKTFIPGILTTLRDEHGIPAKEVQRPNIPLEVWRVLLVLRMANYQDDLALRHWLELMEINAAQIAILRKEAMASEVTLHNRCQEANEERLMALFESIEALRSEATSFERLVDALSRVPAIGLTADELLALLREIQSDEEYPDTLGTRMRLINEKFGVMESESEVPEEDAVLVSTLHSAKGLEAECVFISWMNANYMPMEGRDEEEERRVLYVGMTRAKQLLGFAFHERYDQTRGRRLREEAMSPFLREIADHLSIERVNAESLR
jgi:superfamily I DNA/RNA helicase